MPRLRPSVRAPSEEENLPVHRPAVRDTKPGEKFPGSGRQKGRANYVTRSTREAILEGLTTAGNSMGREGIVSYVVAAAKADFRHGIALLSMVTPRHLNADVTIRNEPVITTIEQLDAELAKAGLPPSRDIFKIDYKGTPAPSDADEAEVVEAEISPPDTVAK
jgi:hypothetical protein